MWFSADGQYLAFIRLRDTAVPSITVPQYIVDNDFTKYPGQFQMRYPKAGQPNPVASFHIVSLTNDGPYEKNKPLLVPMPRHYIRRSEILIVQAEWITEGHNKMLIRVQNRVQNRELTLMVDVEDVATRPEWSARVICRLEIKIVDGFQSLASPCGRDALDGWIDPFLTVAYVPQSERIYSGCYIELSDHTGWAHLYLHSQSGKQSYALTEGEWEVTKIVHIDSKRMLVYYLSTEVSSTSRHLYSVPIGTRPGLRKALVENTTEAVWDASFSPSGDYLMLFYRGPGMPSQSLHSIVNPHKPLKRIQSYAELQANLSNIALPVTTWTKLTHPSGYTLNVRQTVPPSFSQDKIYPVLFMPYGGPGSQTVIKKFPSLDWSAYISSAPTLEYITVTVDGRGTGYQGREFRTVVKGQLGKLDVEDQVWAAREYAKKSWVDSSNMGIWGWSYGGYLAAKVIESQGKEADNGPFAFAIITALVSDWRFYDSVYAERYMGMPEENEASYDAAAVTRPEGFANIRGRVLVQHGTADENVQFQSTYAFM